MNKNSKIFVAGNNGMVGSAITRNLSASGYRSIYFADRQHLDLLNQQSVDRWFKENKIDIGSNKANSMNH